MSRLLKSYGILVLSLAALFASGLMIGRITAPARPARVTAAPTANTAETWLESASRGLQRELRLSPDQEAAIQAPLEAASTALREDQERTLFQMHLRLLVLHDSLARTGVLDASQARQLAASRDKLKRLIVATFPAMVKANPTLAEAP